MTATVEETDEYGREDEAFKVEHRGIDYIPERDRWATPRDLFGMWLGASVQFEYLVYGAVLMTFGFSFPQAVLLILVGFVITSDIVAAALSVAALALLGQEFLVFTHIGHGFDHRIHRNVINVRDLFGKKQHFLA